MTTAIKMMRMGATLVGASGISFIFSTVNGKYAISVGFTLIGVALWMLGTAIWVDSRK